MSFNDYVLDVILSVNPNLGNTESWKAPSNPRWSNDYSDNILCRVGGGKKSGEGDQNTLYTGMERSKNTIIQQKTEW